MARDFQWLVWGFKVRTEHRNAMELADCGSVLLKSLGWPFVASWNAVRDQKSPDEGRLRVFLHSQGHQPTGTEGPISIFCAGILVA